MTRRVLALALTLALGARAAGRLDRKDIRTPAPMPPGSLVVVGFLGAWEAWDNDKRSVRKLALDLRRRNLPGVYVETAGNHSRRTVLRFLRDALDTNRNRKLEPEEARAAQIILYGQSFGGAAAVKLARELNRLGVPVRLTVQVDSVGRDDHLIPPNVGRALNLYQRDPGPVWGENEIRAVDPARTKILGNVRFTYLFRSVDMSDYPRAARRLGVAHWKMDNDPAVWTAVEATILSEIAAWQAGKLALPSR
jgi:pimeloyl-ACP methyl ester carboxylesterase